MASNLHTRLLFLFLPSWGYEWKYIGISDPHCYGENNIPSLMTRVGMKDTGIPVPLTRIRNRLYHNDFASLSSLGVHPDYSAQWKS